MKIIAELCQNHNGKINILKEMISSASRAGASHIKIQHIRPEILNFRPKHENGIVLKGKKISIKRPYKAEYERLSKLVLKDSEIKEFISICNEEGVTPLTTCFARCDVDHIKELGFKEVKVASYDCSSFQLLRELCGKFSHIYISTGATYDDEVKYAVEILKSYSQSFSLLQCTTIYPTPLELINLSRMNYLSSLVDNKNNIGFSDHSSSFKNANIGSMLAIYNGARIIERHYSILPSEMTKDGPVSINESNLTELVAFSKLDKVKQYEYIKNIGFNPDEFFQSYYCDKGLSDEELLNRDYYKGRFASVISRKDGLPNKVIKNSEEIPIK